MSVVDISDLPLSSLISVTSPFSSSRLGIQQDWYDFRDEALSEIAREFLRTKDIPFVEDDERDSA